MFPKTVLFGIILPGVSFAMRVKQSVTEFRRGESFSSPMSYMCKSLLTGLVSGVISVENGVIGGVTTCLRGGRPGWEEWAARVPLYIYLIVQYDLGQRAWPRMNARPVIRKMVLSCNAGAEASPAPAPPPNPRVGRSGLTTCTWPCRARISRFVRTLAGMLIATMLR